MYKLHELKRMFISLWTPNRCPFCDSIIGMTEYWCEECYKNLPFIEESLPLIPNTDKFVSCCYYVKTARRAVIRMKEGFYLHSCDAFALIMTERADELLDDVDFIAAAPSSPLRRFKLGYAQAEVIAKDIAGRTRIPFRKVLKASFFKQQQKKLSLEKKRENARKSFKIVNKKYIKDKNILLVDDVATSGETISAMAELLKSAGASKVYAITFAKTKFSRQNV